MRKYIVLLIALMVGSLIAESCDAAWRVRRGRGRGRRTNVSVSVSLQGTPEMYKGTDQQRAQAEVNYMAGLGRYVGHVGGLIGSYEGCGTGTSANCGTCVPRGRMTLTADAVARGRNGMYYRVRAWR